MEKFYKIKIYKVDNLLNGKCYIGQTFRSFSRRKKEHLRNVKNGISTWFYDAIRKYGEENFRWNVIFEDYCHINKANELEKFFIGYYNSYSFGKNGYNMTEGGEGCNWVGRKHSNESKIKMSKTKKDRIKKGHIIVKNNMTKELHNRITKMRIKNGSYKEAGKKISQNKKNWNDDKRKDVSTKISKSLRETRKNPEKYRQNFMYRFIFSDGMILTYVGSLKKICDELNMSFNKVYRYLNKGVIPEAKGKYKNHIQSINCNGVSVETENFLSMHELFNFHNKASDSQIKQMEKLIKANSWEGVKALFKKVLGVSLV